MGISWREIVGLLIGLAICYAVISYAISYAAQQESSQAAAERTQEESLQRGGTGQQTTGPAGKTETVTLRVTGSSGEPFGANYGNLDSSRTVEGVVPAEYEIKVHTDPGSGDYVSATAWKKTGDDKELTVQVVEGGQVVKESTTNESYGAASLRWSPGERPPATTTPATTTPAFTTPLPPGAGKIK